MSDVLDGCIKGTVFAVGHVPLSAAGRFRLPELCSPSSVVTFLVVPTPEMKTQSHSSDS